MGGTRSWGRGTKYDGYYKAGQKHGRGTYTDEKGDVFVQEWYNGKGKAISVNGKLVHKTYVDANANTNTLENSAEEKFEDPLNFEAVANEALEHVQAKFAKNKGAGTHTEL